MFGFNSLAYLNSGRGRVRASREPLNLYVGDESAVVTALVPGAGSEDVDITIEDRDLSIKVRAAKATNENGEAKSDETVLLRERGEGDYARKVRLPFRVEADKVRARVENGILRVELPRAEADKPRKIKISAA